MFKRDDIVEITQTRGTAETWIGLRARVLEPEPVSDSDRGMWGMTYIEPLSDRTDGRGKTPFYWDTSNLRNINAKRKGPVIEGRYAASDSHLIVQSRVGGSVLVLKKTNPITFEVIDFRFDWDTALADLRNDELE